MAESQGSNMVCCPATTWAQVVAIIQIILNCIGLIILIMALAQLASAMNSRELSEFEMRAIRIALAVVIFAILFSLLGLFMGVLLFVGVAKKRAGFLTGWMVYSVIYSILTIVIVIFKGHLSLIPTVIFFLAGIYIVSMAKDQILEGGCGPTGTGGKVLSPPPQAHNVA